MKSDNEPSVTSWRAVNLEDLLRSLLRNAPVRRTALIGIDGRSGSGKSSLSANLAALSPEIAVVHTDDVAWHQSFFDWADLLIAGVLTPLRKSGPPVSFRPPAWNTHRRPGGIHIPAAARVVLVEGVGACRRRLHPWYCASIWVQADPELAYRRVIARNDDPLEFVDDWTAAEVAFLADDRPWERTSAVVNGQVTPATPSEVFVALSEGSPGG